MTGLVCAPGVRVVGRRGFYRVYGWNRWVVLASGRWHPVEQLLAVKPFRWQANRVAARFMRRVGS